MSLGLGLGATGGGGTNRAQTINVYVASTSGAVYTVSSYGLAPSVAWAKTSGNANLTIASGTGIISATAGIGAGVLQTLVGTVTGSDGVVIPFTANLTGQLTVPGALTLSVAAGNAQNTITITDGATGGTAITARKLYRSTTSGFTPGPGNLIAANATSPYSDTGLTNGTTYYYAGIAENAVGDSDPSTEQSGTPAASVPLPATGNLVAFWDPSVLSSFNGGVNPTDGTQISSWADSISGITIAQATAGTRPIYKASGSNSLPYVSMSGSQMMSVSANATLNTLFTGTTGFTVMAFYRNCVGSSFGIVFQGKGGADYTGVGGTNYASGGTTYGVRTTDDSFPWDGAVGSTAVQSIAQAFRGGVNNQCNSLILNGCPIAMNYNQPYASSWSAQDGTFSLGYLSNANLSYHGELLGLLIWSKALTPTESLQAQLYFYQRHAQTPAWTTAGKLLVVPGDSQTFGFGATNPCSDNWVAVTAKNLSMPVGTWMNLGQTGRNTNEINTWCASAVDGIVSLTGVPCNMAYLEFYNLASGSNGAAVAAANLSFTSARKTAGFNKIGLLTLIDDGGHWTGRSQYLTDLIAGYATNGVSDLIRVDQQGTPAVSGVGQVGCAFTGSPAFAADLIHPNTTGQGNINGVAQPVIATW